MGLPMRPEAFSLVQRSPADSDSRLGSYPDDRNVLERGGGHCDERRARDQTSAVVVE